MNARQLECVLCDIAAQAENIVRLAALQSGASVGADPATAEALVLAVETAAQRVGLLASMALAGVPGADPGPLGFDVERWTMPPVYFERRADHGGVN